MSTVAFVVSDVGYHWEELASAYKEFKAGGWNVTVLLADGAQTVAGFLKAFLCDCTC